MEKKYTWYKIADQEKDILFQENNMAVVMVNDKILSLARFRDKLFAFAYQCPHAGGIMTEGWLDAKGNIVCPLHGYRFNPANGLNVTGEGYILKRWPLETRNDGIYVCLEEVITG